MDHPGAALLGSYDYCRVVLSIVVPMLACYLALDLAVCLPATPGRAS